MPEDSRLDLPIPGSAPAPLSLRTDAMGIFAVLFFAGISQTFGSPTNSIRETLPFEVREVWALTLVIFGALGFISTFMRGDRLIIGMGLEAVARVALGFGALTYAGAVLVVIDFESARFVALTYTGIALLMFVGAWQIYRWLRLQRKSLDLVLGDS